MEQTNNTPGNRWSLLGVSLLALLTTLLGVSAVTDGTETIAGAVQASAGSAEWIFNGYVLAFAALAAVGGKLADVFGRRTTLLAGLGIFAVASVAAGAASDTGPLIATRVAQGSGAALVLPATLALILDAFPRGQRGTAFGFWTAALAVAFAGGVAASGVIIDEAGWRWLFYGGAILAVITGLLAFRFVPRGPRRSGSFDIAGSLVATGGLVALTVALLEGQGTGWDSPLVITLLAAAAAQLAAFVLIERRQPDPLVNIDRLCTRNFGIGSLVMFLASAAILGSFFLAGLQLQQLLGYSTVDTAAALAPLAVVLAVAAPLAGRLSDRFDFRWPSAAGLLGIGGSLWWLATLEATSTRVDFAAPLALLGLGAALVLPAITTTSLSDASSDEHGAASGTFATARNMGAVVGIAVAGSVFVAQVGSQVPKALADSEDVPQGVSEQYKMEIEENGVDLLQLDEEGAGLSGKQSGFRLFRLPRTAESLPELAPVAQADNRLQQLLRSRAKQRSPKEIEAQQQKLKEQTELRLAAQERAIDEGLTAAANRAFQALSIFALLGAISTAYLGRPRRA